MSHDSHGSVKNLKKATLPHHMAPDHRHPYRRHNEKVLKLYFRTGCFEMSRNVVRASLVKPSSPDQVRHGKRGKVEALIDLETTMIVNCRKTAQVDVVWYCSVQSECHNKFHAAAGCLKSALAADLYRATQRATRCASRIVSRSQRFYSYKKS